MRKIIICTKIIFIREEAKARKYTAWEPPVGGEPRHGKKILVKKTDPLGNVVEELD